MVWNRDLLKLRVAFLPKSLFDGLPGLIHEDSIENLLIRNTHQYICQLNVNFNQMLDLALSKHLLLHKLHIA